LVEENRFSIESGVASTVGNAIKQVLLFFKKMLID
jgi:hypothetical protein